jgi:hemerythrin
MTRNQSGQSDLLYRIGDTANINCSQFDVKLAGVDRGISEANGNLCLRGMIPALISFLLVNSHAGGTMPAPAWDQSYETGIASIDAQHAELFRLARELFDVSQVGISQGALAEKLNRLVAYCNTHFEDEEMQMDRLGFPGLQTQQQEHRKLTSRVYYLLEQHAIGASQAPLELSILVSQWLKKHILEFDQVFADFVHQNQMKSS